jgi:hypothetical protein
MSNLCYRNNKLLTPPKTHTKQNKTKEKKNQTTFEEEAEEDEEEGDDDFALIQRITQKSKLGSVARLLDPRTEIYVLLISFMEPKLEVPHTHQ